MCPEVLYQRRVASWKLQVVAGVLRWLWEWRGDRDTLQVLRRSFWNAQARACDALDRIPVSGLIGDFLALSGPSGSLVAQRWLSRFRGGSRSVEEVELGSGGPCEALGCCLRVEVEMGAGSVCGGGMCLSGTWE